MRSRIDAKSATTRCVRHHRVEEIGLQRRCLIRIASIDLELGPCLDPARRIGAGPSDLDRVTVLVAAHVQHRVDEQVGGDPVPFEHDPYGVDEEGCVGR